MSHKSASQEKGMDHEKMAINEEIGEHSILMLLMKLSKRIEVLQGFGG